MDEPKTFKGFYLKFSLNLFNIFLVILLAVLNTMLAIGRTPEPIDVQPAEYAFLIWPLVHIGQLIWLVYAFWCLFRHTPHGECFSTRFDLFTNGLYSLAIASSLANLLWCMTYESSLFSLIFMLAIAGCQTAVVAVAMRVLQKYEYEMRELHLNKDIRFVRVFVVNGSAALATWSLYLSTLVFAQLLIREWGVDVRLASTLAIALFALAFVAYFVVDAMLHARAALNTIYSPYLVSVWTLLAVLVNNSGNSGGIGSDTFEFQPIRSHNNNNNNNWSRDNIFALALLLTVFVCLQVKIALVKLHNRATRARAELRERTI